MLDCRALFEPTNGLPQSETSLLGFPLRLIRLLMHFIVETVVRSFETSRCTALTTRQEKSKTYRLDNLPWFLTGKGPMKSRPVVSETVVPVVAATIFETVEVIEENETIFTCWACKISCFGHSDLF